MVRRLLATVFSPWGKIILAAFMSGVALLTAIPQETHSSIPAVDLNILGYGSVPWNIEAAAPGDGGARGVTLRNVGSEAGAVTIWLSNIRSLEGLNPEPETGDTSEPGELDGYLTLRLAGSGLSGSGAAIPVRDFPTTADAVNKITLGELKPGEDVDLVWEWRLPAATGNEVQGDQLQFNINYLIEADDTVAPVPEKPAPKPTEPIRSIQLVVPGAKSVERIVDKTRSTAAPLTATSTVKPITISIASNSRVVNPTAQEMQARSEAVIDEVPHAIEAHIYEPQAQEAEQPLSLTLPEGWVRVSDVWEILGYTYNMPHHVTIDPPAEIVIGYDTALLPEITDTISLFYWDEVNREWIQLQKPAGYVASEGEVAAVVGHFSIFAVLAKPGVEGGTGTGGGTGPSVPQPGGGEPARPAGFTIHRLTVDPPQIPVGERSTITAVVTNIGGVSGEYTATLTFDGKPLASETLTLRPGESETVTFGVSPGLPGLYGVDVNALAGQLDVIGQGSTIAPDIATRTTYWWLVVVGAALLVFLTMTVTVRTPAPAKVAVGAGVAAGYAAAAAAVRSLRVLPEKPSVGIGTSLRLRAVARFFDGSDEDVTDRVDWSSSDTRVASFLAAKGHEGVVTGNWPGSVTIIARWRKHEAVTMLGVNCTVFDAPHLSDLSPYPEAPRAPIVAPPGSDIESITIAPKDALMTIGETVQFSATANRVDGSSENVTARVVWTSTNDFVADVDAKGSARGFSAGMTAIIATFRGKRGQSVLRVRRPPED